MPTNRRMSDPAYRRTEWKRRYEPHIRPVNRLVEKLRALHPGHVPYVSALYGGTSTEVLFLFQDPGPGTDEFGGSGFLSPENDDDSAQMFSDCLDAVHLDVGRVLTWNACPWSLPDGQERPLVAQVEEGIEPLRQLVGLLPRLTAVVAMGRVAQGAWRRFERRYPEVARQYRTFESPHTSKRGLVGGRTSRDGSIRRVKAAMRSALRVADSA